jgi:hypothetical protein
VTSCTGKPVWGLLVAATAAVSSPSSLGAGLVREYLDETTAATITFTNESMIFARERTELAVNARDYISLTPVEVNRAGTRNYYWFAYVWSTIDRRDDKPLLADEDELVLMADGRPIRLAADARTLRELGIQQRPVKAPARSAIALAFPAGPEIVAHVGASADVSVHLVRGGTEERFDLWADARPALREFVAEVSRR